MMSTSNKICNDGASKSQSNDDGVGEVNNMLQNMSTIDDNDNNNDISNMCANCGKEGTNLNACNRCKMVKYCNAACKKKHRSKHKKKCDRRVAELHDEQLFKQPPPAEDCPICFLRMPSAESGSTYMICCGKVICNGCYHANAKIDLSNQLCVFCRTPISSSDEENNEREKKRADLGDPEAIYGMGNHYDRGEYGYTQNHTKALELWHRSGELGNAFAYNNIGSAYYNGVGVEMDKKKAMHYYELAAMMKGYATARHNLGYLEFQEGNMNRAKKHYMIAVGSGDNNSLNNIQGLHSDGLATKEEFAQALRSYQAYLGEIKSDQRDKAAAYSARYKYY